LQSDGVELASVHGIRDLGREIGHDSAFIAAVDDGPSAGDSPGRMAGLRLRVFHVRGLTQISQSLEVHAVGVGSPEPDAKLRGGRG